MSVKNLEKIVDWIELNIHETNILNDLSEHVGYSKYYCSQRFHEHFGVSLKQYAHKRKMTLAAEDLLNTDRKINELAYYYGFSSTEAFTRAFSKVHGITPFKFRKTQPPFKQVRRVGILSGKEQSSN